MNTNQTLAPKRDSKGRFLKKVTDIVSKTPPKVRLVNLVSINLDESGSMSGFGSNVVNGVNTLLARLREETLKTGQETFVEIRVFGSQYTGGSRNLIPVRPLNLVQDLILSDYRPSGNTPLYDSILQSADSLALQSFPIGTDVSFLVTTITDGQENSSRNDARTVQERLATLQATDKWTFTFSGPRGSKSQVAGRLGIPDGNAEEWEQTNEGWEKTTLSNSRGISNFYGSRASGQSCTKSFHANVPVASQVKRVLTNISGQFAVWSVLADGELSDFVNEKLRQINSGQSYLRTYQKGRAFYQLMKPAGEKVQEYKQALVRNKKTGEIFGGEDARSLLGIDQPGQIRVRAGNVGDFDVFIQSTSHNRKLIAGTELIYRVTP